MFLYLGNLAPRRGQKNWKYWRLNCQCQGSICRERQLNWPHWPVSAWASTRCRCCGFTPFPPSQHSREAGSLPIKHSSGPLSLLSYLKADLIPTQTMCWVVFILPFVSFYINRGFQDYCAVLENVLFFLTTVNPEAGLRVQCVVGYVVDLKKKKPQKNNLLTVIPGTSSSTCFLLDTGNYEHSSTQIVRFLWRASKMTWKERLDINIAF